MYTRAFLIPFALLTALPYRAAAQPAYARDVAPIIQAKCAICHRPNDIAPFSLLTYDDAVTYAPDIQQAVTNRVMPPWKPVPGHGEFRGSFALTDDERTTILNWISNGTPLGDPADMPPAPAAAGGWQLGDPDVVLEMKEPFDVPRARDIYRCFVLPTNFDAEKFVNAIEVVPGNRQIVHHVIAFIDPKGESEKLEGKDGQPGYSCYGGPAIPLTSLGINPVLGFWVPGMRVQSLPENVAIQVQPKTRIILQVHYNPGGRPGPDQTKLGIYFAKQKPDRRLFMIPLINTAFKIPAGASSYNVDTWPVPLLPMFDARIIAIAPHMHLLGRRINVELETVDRKRTSLLRIDDWDFNWQGLYYYQEPVRAPALSALRATCTFDNSENNPKNPNNPLKPVGWGEGTEDEMCLVYLGVTFDHENLLPFENRPVTQ